jgi:hypothetical protein
MVRQVFMLEKVTVDGLVRVRNGLAFGSHPQLSPDEYTGMVTNAVARGNQVIRVVLDKLIEGSAVEELACDDGSFSRIPLGATPDDIARCSGPPGLLAQRCTGDKAVCICLDPNAKCAQPGNVGLGRPIGILDANKDGAPDALRFIDYGGTGCDNPGSTVDGPAGISCGGVPVPLDCAKSYYSPSGNQLIPAGMIGVNGLGPALILVPAQGMRTGSTCEMHFHPEVTGGPDKLPICAPPGGDPKVGCQPGDTSLISFGVEPLTLSSSIPANGSVNVPLTSGGTGNGIIQLQFVAAIDPATLGAITLSNGVTTVTVTKAVDPSNPINVNLTLTGGFAANTTYTVTIGTGLADIFGGSLQQTTTISFST